MDSGEVWWTQGSLGPLLRGIALGVTTLLTKLSRIRIGKLKSATSESVYDIYAHKVAGDIPLL